MDGFAAATRLRCMKYHASEALVDTIADLMTSNLLRVFNERDDARRMEAIARTYTADVTWTDDEGVITGHAAL